MTARRVAITADPKACAAGLAALSELRSAGRVGLDGAIAALASIAAKGDAKPKHRNAREVAVHYAPEHCFAGFFDTACGMNVSRDSGYSEHAETFEIITSVGNLTDATDRAECVTCKSCLRAMKR